jgi:hypothetical protein
LQSDFIRSCAATHINSNTRRNFVCLLVKRQSAFGIRNSLSKLNAMSGVQAIGKLVRGHALLSAPRMPNGNPAPFISATHKICAKAAANRRSRQLCKAKAQESRRYQRSFSGLAIPAAWRRVNCDPPRLIFAEQLGRSAATGFAFIIDVAQCLTVCVTHDETVRRYFGRPRRWEAT